VTRRKSTPRTCSLSSTAGVALDLKSALGDGFLKDFFQSTKDEYAIGWMAQTFGIYYNTNALKQAGVDIPETWDDLISAAKTIRQKTGLTPCSLSNNPGPTGLDLMLPMITQAKDDPKYLLDIDMQRNGASWDSAPVAQTPAGRPGAKHWCSNQAGAGLAVSAASKNSQAAVDFIKWLYEPARYSKIMNDSNSMPSTQKAVEQIQDPFMKKMTSWLLQGNSCPHILFGKGSSDSASNQLAAVIGGPGVATMVIFQFMFTWNEFILANTLLQTPDNMPLQPVLFALKGRHGNADRPLVTAALLISIVPVIIVYIRMQRRFVQGLTVGALKT
jgi:raffinose/stachyose/melibiose transport system substrate-binding protein